MAMCGMNMSTVQRGKMRNAMLVAAGAMLCATGAAQAQNVALDKPVTIITGADSVLAPAPALDVVNDGLFLSEATSYSHPSAVAGSVRWNTGIGGATVIEINLQGMFAIDGIIVQADDNDALLVTYKNASGEFVPLYNVQLVSVGFGFRTRPFADQAIWADVPTVTTDTIRITNNGGDGFYGLSEIQLRGTAVAGCDDIDFNNNDVFPEDQDVVDYLNVLAGGECPACNDIDFNNNGVFPEDQDVIDFFNVLAGGACP